MNVAETSPAVYDLAERLATAADAVCDTPVKRGHGAPLFQYFVAEHQGIKMLVTVGPMKE